MKKQSIKGLQEKIEDLNNKWKRALADYQNLEKRASADRQMLIKIANLDLYAKLLPVVDDLERASQHLNDEGLKMILKQITAIFEADGLRSIDPINQKFDPKIMECVDRTEGEENLVVSVNLKGYLLGEIVVRPAKVVVGTKIKK